MLVWILYFYLMREALAQGYALLRQAPDWLFYNGPRPFLPVIASFLDTIGTYGLVILVNSAALIGWAIYNNLRYRGKHRRLAAPLVTPADLATLYHVPVSDITSWQNARILKIQHAGDGSLTRVIIMPDVKSLEVPDWVSETAP